MVTASFAPTLSVLLLPTEIVSLDPTFSVLLEPIVNLEVTVPSKYTGAILGDLNTKRARIENQDSLPGDLAVIAAKAPLAEVTRYAAQLGSITQGQGSYTMEFSHYDMVPGNVQQQIVSKAKLAEEEED